MKTETDTPPVAPPKVTAKYEVGSDGRVSMFEIPSGRPIRVYPVDADELIGLGHASLAAPVPEPAPVPSPPGATVDAGTPPDEGGPPTT